MILVTFTVHERKFVESVDPATTVKAIADAKGIGANEKIYVDGTPVEDRTKTLRDLIGARPSCAFNVITKTNNAR